MKMTYAARKKIGKLTAKSSRPSSSSALSKKAAAAKLASMIEEHMDDLGLTEIEKDARVVRFGQRVDAAIATRAKS